MPKTQPNPRTIKAKDFVKDMHSGMTDLDMIQKYGLTLQSFDRVLEYLVDAGLITIGELLERQHVSDSQVFRAFVESSEEMRIPQKHAPRLSRPRTVTISGKREAKMRRGQRSRRIDPVMPRGLCAVKISLSEAPRT